MIRNLESPTEVNALASAMVVYRSHSGVTRHYGEAIAAFLTARGVSVRVVSVGECDIAAVAGADYLFLGCWTNGLFLIGQHPDEPWLAFVRELPALAGAGATPSSSPKTALFTTYKLRTGSMFARMRVALAGKVATPGLQLQSRRGALSPADEKALEEFIA